MTLLLILFVVAVGFFTFVLLFGAPYLPTLKKYRTQALDLLDLKPGQVFYELGCGDGSMTIEAAKRGWQVVGYELNPILAFIARVRTRKYKSQVTIVCGNFWFADLTKADGVFVFLLDRFMTRLDEKLTFSSNKKKIKFVSYAFKIPGKKAVRKSGPMFLYEYD